MTGFARVLPYISPHRRQLFFSFGFAVMVALLWGCNLSIAFPVFKVLLEGESLHDYVQVQIDKNEKESNELMENLESIEKRLRETKMQEPIEKLKPADQQIAVEILEKKAKLQSELTTASGRVLGYRSLQSNVMPFVPRDRFDTFAVILAILLLATIVKGAFMFAQDVMVGSVVQLATMGIRKSCFREALKLDYQTLAAAGTSDLMSRLSYDIDTLATGLELLGGKVVREPLKALVCVAIAFYINWQLTLLTLAFVPVALLIFSRFGQVLKRASHRSMESMSRIYKVMEETLDAMKVVIAFNGAARHRQRFHCENKTYYKKSMNIVMIDSVTSPVTEVLGILAVLAAVLPGAYLVLRGTNSIWGINLAAEPMTMAQLTFFYAALIGISDPVRKLSSVYAKLKKSAAAADRIFEIMDRKTLVKEPLEPKELPRHTKTIEFRKVSFTYATNEASSRPAALEEVNLKLNAGEVIAVVGDNGSGKSTLVNLLPRFYDPNRGSVLIDGVDIRSCRLSDLRSQLGVVTQETLLFDETIFDNIRYGKLQATWEEVERAAEQAHVLQFLGQLPDGFETRVGEKGSRLSGGQRQRIALARAILRDPAILILDEATSAIDAQSAYLIHKTLANFVKGRTTFIITHFVSQSLLELVTRIVVLDQGRLQAVGTHGELLQSCPAYQRLYHMQVQERAA